MKLVRTESFEDDLVRYFLEVSSAEMQMADFDWLDRGLMRETEATASIADKLLALEMLARRVEEAYHREESDAQGQKAQGQEKEAET